MSLAKQVLNKIGEGKINESNASIEQVLKKYNFTIKKNVLDMKDTNLTQEIEKEINAAGYTLYYNSKKDVMEITKSMDPEQQAREDELNRQSRNMMSTSGRSAGFKTLGQGGSASGGKDIK